MYISRPYRHAILGAVAVVLVLGANLLLFSALNPTGNHDPFRVCGLVAFVLIKLCFLAAYVGFIVQGARVHWGWGCANFLLPVSALFFLIRYPKSAKIPSLILLAGILLLIFLTFGAMLSGHWEQPLRH